MVKSNKLYKLETAKIMHHMYTHKSLFYEVWMQSHLLHT